MSTRKQDIWTTRRLLGLSQNLSAGYGLSIKPNEAQRQDAWTTDKLIKMSNGFAQAYGADIDQ